MISEKTYQLVLSGQRGGKYFTLAQSPAGCEYNKADRYFLAIEGGCFREVSPAIFNDYREDMELHIIHETHPCGSIDELTEWANKSCHGRVH